MLRSLLGDNYPPMSVVTSLASEMPCECWDYDLIKLSYGWILILAGHFSNFTDNPFGFNFFLRSLLVDSDPLISVVNPLISEMHCE